MTGSNEIFKKILCAYKETSEGKIYKKIPWKDFYKCVKIRKINPKKSKSKKNICSKCGVRTLILGKKAFYIEEFEKDRHEPFDKNEKKQCDDEEALDAIKDNIAQQRGEEWIPFTHDKECQCGQCPEKSSCEPDLGHIMIDYKGSKVCNTCRFKEGCSCHGCIPKIGKKCTGDLSKEKT